MKNVQRKKKKNNGRDRECCLSALLRNAMQFSEIPTISSQRFLCILPTDDDEKETDLNRQEVDGLLNKNKNCIFYS